MSRMILGTKKIITKRGAKYPERIINATKAAVSLMYCGNALGEVLPPYVIYKADCLWSTWMENGPPKARYNRSKSGWFDATSFETGLRCSKHNVADSCSLSERKQGNDSIQCG